MSIAVIFYLSINWGSVPDWAAVVVYAMTGILIWLTLRSQTKVQEAQAIITRIEAYEHLEKIKPAFGVQPEFPFSDNDQGNQHTQGVLTAVLNENHANDFSFDIVVLKATGAEPWVEADFTGNFARATTKINFTIDLVHSGAPANIHGPDQFCEINIVFYFTDQFKNEYIQTVNVRVKYGTGTAYSYPPVTLTPPQIFDVFLHPEPKAKSQWGGMMQSVKRWLGIKI